MGQGKCASSGELTKLFYPDTNSGEVARSKAVCWGLVDSRPCPVREECLEYALLNDERFGVWGGLSERERRTLRRYVKSGGMAAALVRARTLRPRSKPKMEEQRQTG